MCIYTPMCINKILVSHSLSRKMKATFKISELFRSISVFKTLHVWVAFIILQLMTLSNIVSIIQQLIKFSLKLYGYHHHHYD